MFKWDDLFEFLCFSYVMFSCCSNIACIPNDEALYIPWSLISFEMEDILISFGLNFRPGINFLNFLENFFWSFDLVKSNTKCPVNVFPVEVVKLLSWYFPFSILKFLKSITWSYRSSAIMILFLWFFLFA